MPTVRTSDNVPLRTQSHRRYVVFNIADDSRVYVVKRSDNPETAKAEFVKARKRGYLRVVLVDFVGWHNDPGARIVLDTAKGE